jgi:hypothetical protein
MARALLLALATALVCPDTADAFTLYFAGSEDISFTSIGAAQTAIGSSCGVSIGCRSSFAHAAVQVGNGTSTSDPPANRLQTPTFSSVSTLWIHANFWSYSSTTGTSGEQALLIRSPDGVARILLRQTGTSGTLKASKRNAAGTITDLATASGTFPASTNTSLDLEIVYGCTSSDQVVLYLAGTQVINYTGASICTDSATSLNQVEFMGVNNGTGNANSCNITQTTCWSEVIIADSDTRGMGLWALAPQAAGNTQNTVGDVNPTAFNDANFVSTGSNNALSEWTTPTTAPSGTWNVQAVVQEARVLASTSGPQHFEWLARTKDGTDHVTGSVAPPIASFGNFNNQIWATNPHTSAAWVISDIASGFNLGIESLP